MTVVSEFEQLQSIDLHDASIKTLHVNYEAKTVIIEIEYYLEPIHTKHRTPAIIKFTGVRSVQQICDFSYLKKNAAFGNIAYWQLPKAGSAHIYAFGGLLAITATTLSFETSS